MRPEPDHRLTGGPLSISKKVRIDGGNGFVTLSGNNVSRLFSIADTGKATLRRLNLTRGLNAGGDGGAIVNLGKLNVDICIVSDNNAAGSGAARSSTTERLTSPAARSRPTRLTNGGAIYNEAGATVNLSQATFDRNQAVNKGGALYNASNASVFNTTLSGNCSPELSERGAAACSTRASSR